VTFENTVTVVGLGKIGLPLAVQFARKGFQVIGVDVNELVVSEVNQGKEPFPGEKQLSEFLRDAIEDGRLLAQTDTVSAVRNSGTVVVVVPLYVDEEGVPDFRSIDDATSKIALGLQKGTLVSYETTLPVGTTRNRFSVNLEKSSGLRAGEDFQVVFSPERVLTGRVFEDLKQYPKLVGGISPLSELRGLEFYSSVLDFNNRPELSTPNGVWAMGSSEAAEFAKLAETTYRDVNIALTNQFALYASRNQIDIYKVIEASNSQPYSHLHQPGIAVGGHCIPIYPQMYLWNDPEASVVRAAREANRMMPHQCVEKLENIHGNLNGETIGVLGASYRGGVKETAFSGVFSVVQRLVEKGAKVLVHDPMYSDQELEQLGFSPLHLGDSIDALIVQANHEFYSQLTKEDFPGIQSVLDGRGVLTEANWNGKRFHLIGRG